MILLRNFHSSRSFYHRLLNYDNRLKHWLVYNGLLSEVILILDDLNIWIQLSQIIWCKLNLILIYQEMLNLWSDHATLRGLHNWNIQNVGLGVMNREDLHSLIDGERLDDAALHWFVKIGFNLYNLVKNAELRI